MQRRERVLWTTFLFALALPAACALGLYLRAPAAAQTSRDPVIYLDQAWSQADREAYYQTSQGARVMSYDIFLNLEVASSQELFRSDANSERYGLIPQAANPRTNPDALPIGVTKTVTAEGRWKGEQMGVTCALCHTGQLAYQGKRILIDGGTPNTLDFMSYVQALDDALQATLTDAAKFDRLAARLGASSADARSALRKRFESEAASVHYYRTRTLLTPVAWGPARVDAFGLITNRVVATQQGIPENLSAPIAPVKPPFLWNAAQATRTQWGGSGTDPILRNVGETMGVYLSMDLTSKSPAEGLFDTSSEIRNLHTIELLIWRLAPPKWPEEVFGKIDRAKATRGKALFAEHCASCHSAWPYTWTEPNKYGMRFFQVQLVPQSYVGTDPGQFKSARPYSIVGSLKDYLPPPYTGMEIVPTSIVKPAANREILNRELAKLNLTEEETIEIHGYRELPTPPAPIGVYKAAPRDGAWATPPFMHNGSVPNLYEMLLPAAQRTKKFYIGREFDPVKVGLDTSEKPGAFLLDTSLDGNSNAGHSFENGPLGNGVVGPLFSEEERWALVEYLKSIPEEAGRVTPFGGP